MSDDGDRNGSRNVGFLWASDSSRRFDEVQLLWKLQVIWGCIQKFPDWVDNEIYAYNNKHSLRSNTKGYGGKTH
jgi:hypothetical protein